MTAAPRLELLPAVDVQGGRAVQLVQGVAGSGGEFGDPWAAARAWQDQGAQWLHLVDLDGAPVFMAQSAWALNYEREKWPAINFADIKDYQKQAA